ncbi:MAG: LOG family protein [Planctomycetes bacterium]|nr:LOG family protein [Phycisphaerae bacterium]NBB95689.1 LOG family protein [Planctomycetota bacterium]
MPVISVYGSGDPAPGSEAYATAREVGRVLAALGYAVANGGYGGTMEASARGAREVGGHTIGVPCRIWSSSPRREVLSEVHMTDSYEERLATLIALGSGGYVVLPGATGTLVELAWVWEQACKGFLDVARQPIACLGGFWQPLVDMMVSQRRRSVDAVHVVTDPGALAEVFPAVDAAPGR